MHRLFLPVAAALLALAGCSTQKLPEGCYLKPESGRCKAAIMRYWYDEGANSCKGFIWGGCGGVVPYETLDACHAQCMPGLPMPDSPVHKAQLPAEAAPAATAPAEAP